MLKKGIAVILLAALAGMASNTRALETAEPSLDRLVRQTDFGSVAYPALNGYPDELIRVSVNLLLLEKGRVLANIDTLNRQDATGWGMDEDYSAFLGGGILSVVFSMYGDLGGFTASHAFETLSYDLNNGRLLTPEDLFTDIPAARDHMELIMLDTVAPNLSGYVVNEQVTPLPMDRFSLTDKAITFYYDADQLMMLSGFSGSASFFYYELAPWLNLEAGGVLDRMGAGDYLHVMPDSSLRIASDAEQGRLPGVPVRPGEWLADVFLKYRLFCDPDYFPSGRFYQMEAGEMRGILLLTDRQPGDPALTPVGGVRCDRLNLYGIKVGESVREEWLGILGEPDDTVDLDAYTAQDYWLPAGTSDSYVFGGYTLRFHSDRSGLLACVYLTQ